MLGGKHAFRVNLPACIHYGNSQLLMWHRTDAFRGILRDTCGQRYTQLFLPIGWRALWNELHSGSNTCQRQLFLPIRECLVWDKLPGTGLSAGGGGGDSDNNSRCHLGYLYRSTILQRPSCLCPIWL